MNANRLKLRYTTTVAEPAWEKRTLNVSDYIASKSAIIAVGSLIIVDTTRKETRTSSAAENAVVPIKQDRSLFCVIGAAKQSPEKKAQFVDLGFIIFAIEVVTRISLILKWLEQKIKACVGKPYTADWLV